MIREALLLVTVGCMVALAGCGGALTADDGPTRDDVSYPDAVSENGTNVSALVDGHAAALNDSSFTLSIELDQNSSTGERSVEMDARVSDDRENVRATVVGDDEQTSLYLTEETRYEKQVTGNETDYRVTDRRSDAVKLVPSSYSGGAYIEQFGAGIGANFTPTDVREVHGTTVVALRADGSNVSTPDSTEIVEYNATILVDERGVVHSFEVSVESERDGDATTLSFSMELSDLNETTVEEPSWLDEARNQTSD